MVEHVTGENPNFTPRELLKSLTNMVISEAKKKSAYFGGYGNAIYGLTQGMEMTAEILVRANVANAKNIEGMIYEIISEVKKQA